MFFQAFWKRIELNFHSSQLENDYKNVHKLHAKNFFRIIAFIISFISITLIVHGSMNHTYWAIIPPSIWIFASIFLWIYYNKLGKFIDYLSFILYLTYCGVCLYLLKDPDLPTISNVYFYQGYSYGIFEKIITIRLPYFSFKILLASISFGLRIYLYPVSDPIPIVLQALMFMFSLMTDYWKEREDRSVFQDCFNYREELTKFQTLIVSNLPTKILILSDDLKEILFKNEGLTRSIQRHRGSRPNMPELGLLYEWLEQLKMDPDNFTQRTKNAVASSSHFDHELKDQTVLDLLKAINSAKNQVSKDQQKYGFNSEMIDHITETKKIFETKIFSLTWDAKNAIALIFNDATEHCQNLTLKVADINKNKMLAMISHELKTPLNGILGVVNILKREITESHLLHYLSICKSSGELLLNLVNSILDLQYIRDNKFTLKLTKDNVHELLKGIYDLFKFQFEHKGLELELKISPDIPEFIVTDQDRLRQILINLIGNAHKFTFKGGVIISAGLDLDNDGYIKFKVSDTGIGIKEEDKKKLFKMYGRLDHADSKVNTQGTGFGLEISDQLAKLLADDIEEAGIKVESTQNVGTTFSFSIRDSSKIRLCESSDHKDYSPALQYYEPGVFDEDIEDISVKMSPYSYPSVALYTDKSFLAKPWRSPDSNAGLMYCDTENNAAKSTDSFELSIVNKFALRKREASRTRTLPNQGVYFNKIQRQESRGKKQSNTSTPTFVRPKNKPKSRILIVDDNAFNLMIAQNILESLGYSVETALNGKLGVEAVLKASKTVDRRFDAVLMDIQMPVMDGYEATLALKEMMKNKEIVDIPIIAVSANDSENDKKRCREVGMYGHISKPLDGEKLRAVLEEALNTVFSENEDEEDLDQKNEDQSP